MRAMRRLMHGVGRLTHADGTSGAPDASVAPRPSLSRFDAEPGVGCSTSAIPTRSQIARPPTVTPIGSGDEWLTNLSTDQLRDYLSLSKEAVGEFE